MNHRRARRPEPGSPGVERAQSSERGCGNHCLHAPHPPRVSFMVSNTQVLSRMPQAVTPPMDPPRLPASDRRSFHRSRPHLLVLASPAVRPPPTRSALPTPSPPKLRPWGGARAGAGTCPTGRRGRGTQSVGTRPGRWEGARAGRALPGGGTGYPRRPAQRAPSRRAVAAAVVALRALEEGAGAVPSPPNATRTSACSAVPRPVSLGAGVGGILRVTLTESAAC